jgi:hypothetical protein
MFGLPAQLANAAGFIAALIAGYALHSQRLGGPNRAFDRADCDADTRIHFPAQSPLDLRLNIFG